MDRNAVSVCLRRQNACDRPALPGRLKARANDFLEANAAAVTKTDCIRENPEFQNYYSFWQKQI
jgi:hypothetical protein